MSDQSQRVKTKHRKVDRRQSARLRAAFYAATVAVPLLALSPVARAQNDSSPQPLTGSFALPAGAAASTPLPGSVISPIPAPATAGTATNPAILPEDRSLADARREVNAGAPVFTLTEAIGLALQNNPQHDAALAAVRAARARITTAKAGGGLQINLAGEADEQHAFGFPGGTSTSGGGFSSSGTTAGDRWSHSESLSATATLPIYTGGRVSANKRVARYSAEAQEAQALQTDQQLVYNTTLAYLSILRSEQLLDVAGANLDVARERQRVAQVRYDAGAAARLEVLQADADLATARQQRIVASNSLGQSNAALNTLLGRAPDTPLRVEPILQLTLPSPLVVTPNAAPLGTTAQTTTGTTTGSAGGTATAGALTNTTGSTGTSTFGSTAPTTGSTGLGGSTPVAGVTGVGGVSSAGTSGVTISGLGTTGTAGAGSISGIAPAGQLQLAAGQSRNSLAVTQAQIKAAEASVDLARAARKPNIGANILGMLRNPLTFAGRFLFSLGASVAQTLFDSGKSRGQIQEALAVVDELRSQYKGQQLAVANDIEQSLLDLDSAQKRLNSTQSGVTAAQEALRAAQLGYSAGVTTSVEVSNAQAALLTAQTDAVNARFDLAAAQAQLAAAVGVVPVEGQAAFNRAAKEVQRGKRENDKR
jgi:outer membrane protein TolC